MKLISLLYYHGSRLKLPWSHRGDERFHTARQFDRLYRLDEDPFGVETSSYEAEKASALLRILSEQPLGNMLDVGCGTGELTRKLSPFAMKIIAVDYSRQAIEIAVKKHRDLRNVVFRQANISSLDHGEHFDTIVCSEVLYYLNEDELSQALTAIERLSEPAARLIAIARADDELLWKRLRARLRVASFETFDGSRRPFSIGVFTFSPISE